MAQPRPYVVTNGQVSMDTAYGAVVAMAVGIVSEYLTGADVRDTDVADVDDDISI